MQAAGDDLRRTEAEGYTHVFLEAGPRLVALQDRLAVPGARLQSPDDVELLTEHEGEVLRLMAEGSDLPADHSE